MIQVSKRIKGQASEIAILNAREAREVAERDFGHHGTTPLMRGPAVVSLLVKVEGGDEYIRCFTGESSEMKPLCDFVESRLSR